jgi:hypothetical protein
MAQSNDNVDVWVARIQKTRSSKELLKILEEFRKFEWHDLERQKVSHTYMKVLDVILNSPEEKALRKEAEAAAAAAAASSGSANDGPVWYEKM